MDTVVRLALAKWETVSGRFGGYLTLPTRRNRSPRKRNPRKLPTEENTPRSENRFREREIRRLLRAAQKEKRSVECVEVDPGSGIIRIILHGQRDAPSEGSDLDQWMAKHANQTQRP